MVTPSDTRMPKVSVVIPVYNRAGFLPETIQSIVSQSFSDFEVIVVDDGSTDNTRDSVSSLPVRYVWQENQGASIARNKGFELAKGTYVVFLDSDDVLLKDALAKGVRALDDHPEVGFSYGQGFRVDENGQILGLSRSPCKSSCVRAGVEVLHDIVTFGNYISGVMIRRSCIKEGWAFDPTWQGSQDLELWVRLAKRYAVAYIAEPLVKYRIHPNRLTQYRKLEEMEQKWNLILESIFNGESLPLSGRASAYSRLYWRLAGHALSRRQMKTARIYLFRVRTCPKTLMTLGLCWILRFFLTWVPVPALGLASAIKRYSATLMWRLNRPVSTP